MNKKIKKMNAVMMEYVLIAVLIAAAVVGAVMMFGKSISGGMDVAATSIVNPGQASSSVNDARTAKSNAKGKAASTMRTIHGDSAL